MLIISHTPHYQEEGQISAWGSTVREIDQLATLFDEVVHLAPLHSGPAPESSLPYSSPKVSYHAVRPAGGEKFVQKTAILWQIPAWMKKMRTEMQQADAIHIRCPANISLVALIARHLWAKNKPCWVKYAGSWSAKTRQPFSYRLQHAELLRSVPARVVSVNGRLPSDPRHILSFYNPSFSEEEYLLSRELAQEKSLTLPLQLLFVGRLEQAKGFGRVIEITRELASRKVEFTLDAVGDGPERAEFEARVQQLGLSAYINFYGWKKRLEINDFYQKAHIILLPSTSSEGWPKVLSEAMAFGVVPIASDAGSISEILQTAQIGVSLPPNNLPAFTAAIEKYNRDPLLWKQECVRATAFAERFSYEHYLERIRQVFLEFFDVELNHA